MGVGMGVRCPKRANKVRNYFEDRYGLCSRKPNLHACTTLAHLFPLIHRKKMTNNWMITITFTINWDILTNHNVRSLTGAIVGNCKQLGAACSPLKARINLLTPVLDPVSVVGRSVGSSERSRMSVGSKYLLCKYWQGVPTTIAQVGATRRVSDKEIKFPD